MKVHLLIASAFTLFALSCDKATSPERTYEQFDPEACSSSMENKTADIGELAVIDKDNVSEYRVSGTCEREKSEVKVYIQGYPLDSQPLCNRGQWEISVDITGIVNKRERVQVAISQAGSTTGVLCKHVTNYFVCPQGYIGVPSLDDFVNDAFCVMKYEAKVESGTKLPTFRSQQPIKALALAKGVLIDRVDTDTAITSCKENGAGYDLINNDEWQTIARHIEKTPANWSDGEIKIKNGNRLNIGNTSGTRSNSDDDDIDDDRWSLNKRYHKLPNNEYIWDFAGNLSEIVQQDFTAPTVKYNGYVYEAPTEIKNLLGPDRDYSIFEDRERVNRFGGLGYIESNSFRGGLLRGGNSTRNAGVFSANTSIAPNRVNRNKVGFRCIYNP